ncbi:MAG: ABC transporter permease subunit [Acidobacteria bacterium]|nr:ABC transporter permease subunit [Acidobacteriota bacterium]
MQNNAAAPVTPQTAPGFLYSALRVFDLSLGQMLWSRRTIFMLLVVGVPVLLALIVRMIDSLSGSAMQVNGVAMSGPAIFGMMIWMFFVRFTVPVLSIFYGTALVADEVEDKTITFLFTRPIPRGAVLVGKYFAFLASTLLVVLPSVMLVWLLVVPIRGSLGASFPELLKDLVILAVGFAVYGSLFAFIGARFKRPLMIALFFVFAWEQAALLFPGYMRRFTIAHYLQGLVPHAMPSDGAVSLIQSVFQETPALGTSIFWLAAIWAVFLWLAARTVERKEYVLEQ